MEPELKKIVYSRDAIEFVTVAVQYCGYLETFEDEDTIALTDKLTKLLPLLYLKVSMLPETALQDDENPEIEVTEDMYNYIFSRLFAVYAKDDAYLEVFVEDMKFSDTPIGASISEDLTDIYQDLKNFITIYERGIEENMNDALFVCNENFKLYWGQKLTNVLRALHALKYAAIDVDNENDESLQSEEEMW
ncbi:MAG: DUF5063 domain-containing protein [Dysgonomonas sp.]